jgi:hypothetical protein
MARCGADGVVVAAKSVQLALQLFDGGRGWLGGQPLLLGLVEPLHLAAGLRMPGPGVVEPDAEQVELELQGDPAAAARLAGEDRGIVGEHPRGDAVAAEGAAEAGHHVLAGGGVPGL